MTVEGPLRSPGLRGLAAPAIVNETLTTTQVDALSQNWSPEAEDTPNEGRGSGGPFLQKEPDSQSQTEGTDNQNLEDESDQEIDEINDEEQTQENRPTPYERPTPPTLRHKQWLPGPKPGLKIACLNMRGRNSTLNAKSGRDKFKMISRWMRIEKINILALLDTHWDEEYERSLQKRYLKHTFLCNHKSSNRGGIAFVIDKQKEQPKKSKLKTIIPGRCASVELEYEHQKVGIIALYMPTDRNEKLRTISILHEELKQKEYCNDWILTGDFNLVEDERDRYPIHPDEQNIVDNMTKLRADLGLVDGWRETHEEETAFTWRGKSGEEATFARIDRIYIPERSLHLSNEWEILEIERTISDHHAVAVKLLEPDPPFIGRGEWRLKLHILENDHFKKEATIALQKARKEMDKYLRRAAKCRGNQTKLENTRRQINPQKVWQIFKKGVQRAAKEAEEMRKKAISKELNELTRQLHRTRSQISKYKSEREQKTKRKDLDKLECKISDVKKKHRLKAEATVAAKWLNAEEKGNKLWFATHKEVPRNQIFHSLFKPDGTETQNTDEMKEIARCFYEQLQEEQTMNLERLRAIDDLLSKVDNDTPREILNELDKKITLQDVFTTIKSTKNGKAPGCDGIPNEYWKQELEWKEEADDPGSGLERPDITKLMMEYFEDIENFGPEDEDFTEGRMSLLHKKKDRRDIGNYRPITLLNTDYKIYTTILTNKLKLVAPSLIHPDQAGFMPKRSIYDQTKLIEYVIRLCENKSQNGMILALDQEKAYDRIDHGYLWMVMEKFKIPHGFINKVKNLYTKAITRIKINNCTCEPFPVKRGVRQGDPLSCLLYNLAIEPLFEAIRKSGIKGLQIHRDTENALVSAYADDTSVFLCEDDDPNILLKCIDTFCKASTAKFNNEKTEIIPVGKPEFRKRLIQSRHINGWTITSEMKVAQEDESIRILGSLQGNKVDTSSKWNEIITKQLRIMNLWSKSYPSALARSRITKSLIVSRGLYFMMVNGIEKQYIELMEKNIRNFIWQGKKGPISWTRAVQNKNEGGIGAPSIPILYETTIIMWIKRWLTPGKERPKWAWAANSLLEEVPQSRPPVASEAITEWIEQTWDEKGHETSLPKSLREMLRVARKHSVKISVLRAPDDLKMSMPAFYHPGRASKSHVNSKVEICLRENHSVKTVGDLINLHQSNAERNTNCINDETKCKRHAKKILEKLPDLWNPLSNSPKRTQLYYSPEEIKRYAEADIKQTPIPFNPDPNDQTDKLSNVRIFGERTSYIARNKMTSSPTKPLRIRAVGERRQDNTLIKIYTDGSALRNGWENATTGIGNWHEENSDKNVALKLEGKAGSNQRAELAAILAALKNTPNSPLLIITDSLSSANTICRKLSYLEDIGWYKTKDADILMNILHELRTRPTRVSFQWVKAHEEDKDNEKADELANKGRESHISFEIPDINANLSRAIHDGARLNSLTMKITYGKLVEMTAMKDGKIKHPEVFEDAKMLIEQETGLRPTTEAMIKGIWKLDVPGRVKDNIWNLLIGRIKCGEYWTKMPEEYQNRRYCLACKQAEGTDEIESPHHMWLECSHNGQSEAWSFARRVWYKRTRRKWPTLSIGLIRGAGAISLSEANNKTAMDFDSERVRILIAMTIWSIWKTRNRRILEESNPPKTEPRNLLRDMMTDYITKSWDSLEFETSAKRKGKRIMRLTGLWDRDFQQTLQ